MHISYQSGQNEASAERGDRDGEHLQLVADDEADNLKKLILDKKKNLDIDKQRNTHRRDGENHLKVRLGTSLAVKVLRAKWRQGEIINQTNNSA